MVKILIITDVHYPLERQEYEVIQSNTYDACFLLGDMPLDAVVTNVEKKKVTKSSGKLFSLSKLQGFFALLSG